MANLVSLVIEKLALDGNKATPKMVKAMRVLDPSASLREAVELTHYLATQLPCVVATGISEAHAREVIDALVKYGGAGRVEPSDAKLPMIVRLGVK
jgi:hypothetical protein